MKTSALSILMLALTALPAQALNLDDALKGLQETTQPSPTTPGSADAQPPINLKTPSREDEIRLGREISGNLLGAAPLVKDDQLQKYVNQVGRWVALQSERPDLPWHFGVIDSEDLNAFAAPGGWVLVTKGLYRKLNNEAELAAVLGHEIGHVVRKHQLKLIQKQQALSLGAGLIGGTLGKDSQLVQQLIGSGAEICARSLDKDAEFEADRIGVVLSGRAGYDAYGLVEVLQEIGHVGKDDGSVALLFKTHPHPDDRLVKLGDAVGNRLDGVKEGKLLAERFYQLKN
jgi:predicted Zn-dependent protease